MKNCVDVIQASPHRQIEMTDVKVSARALFDALTNSWTEDGILDEMRKYLRAFASDGGYIYIH